MLSIKSLIASIALGAALIAAPAVANAKPATKAVKAHVVKKHVTKVHTTHKKPVHTKAHKGAKVTTHGKKAIKPAAAGWKHHKAA